MSKRQIVDGEVYLWTRKGWRLVRDGMIRTRRGWRQMRRHSTGRRRPSTTASIDAQPAALSPCRQWHGKYAILQSHGIDKGHGRDGQTQKILAPDSANSIVCAV